MLLSLQQIVLLSTISYTNFKCECHFVQCTSFHEQRSRSVQGERAHPHFQRLGQTASQCIPWEHAPGPPLVDLDLVLYPSEYVPIFISRNPANVLMNLCAPHFYSVSYVPASFDTHVKRVGTQKCFKREIQESSDGNGSESKLRSKFIAFKVCVVWHDRMATLK